MPHARSPDHQIDHPITRYITRSPDRQITRSITRSPDRPITRFRVPLLLPRDVRDDVVVEAHEPVQLAFEDRAPDRCARRSPSARPRRRSPGRCRSTAMPLARRYAMSVAPVLIVGQRDRVVVPLDRRFERSVNASESRRVLPRRPDVALAPSATSTAGSLMTLRTSSRNASGSSSGSMRTSSVAFASDGITLTR